MLQDPFPTPHHLPITTSMGTTHAQPLPARTPLALTTLPAAMPQVTFPEPRHLLITSSSGTLAGGDKQPKACTKRAYTAMATPAASQSFKWTAPVDKSAAPVEVKVTSATGSSGAYQQATATLPWAKTCKAAPASPAPANSPATTLPAPVTPAPAPEPAPEPAPAPAPSSAAPRYTAAGVAGAGAVLLLLPVLL